MKRRHFLCTLAGAAASLSATGPALASGESMLVYKDPNCGCCQAWGEAMMKAGFAVTIENVDDLDAVKQRFAIPAAVHGCHTAIIGDYYVEGHVPLEAVRQLLKERPEIAGIAVPGMPAGSLGMGDDPGASYDVIALNKAGASSLYLAVRP